VIERIGLKSLGERQPMRTRALPLGTNGNEKLPSGALVVSPAGEKLVYGK
jgi:hypothetical protein